MTTAASLEALEAFLVVRGAQARPHSGRNLLAHLRGTYQLLTDWGNPAPVALAGMCHSVYGTNAFQHVTIDLTERDAVRALVGEQAEALAYVFCSVNRPRAIVQTASKADGTASQSFEIAHRRSQEVLAVSREQLRQLVEIEVANLIEQGDRGRQLEELFFLAFARDTWLSTAAHKALRNYLKAAPPTVMGTAKASGPRPEVRA